MATEVDIKDLKMWVDNNLLLGEEVTVQVGDADSVLGIYSAEFTSQPPSNIRKSNFFNFSIRLYDRNQQLLTIESSSFISFCDDVFRNGVQYSVNLILSDMRKLQQSLFIRLVDSVTKELVKFDSPGRKMQSEEMQRVLVTHRAVCSRCADGKVCGNKNDTPTNPVISDNYDISFFLKCNQNCLKGPGNPKSSPRRFQLIVSTSEDMDSLCISQQLFVHNNSKHTKAKSFKQIDDPLTKNPKTFPRIIAISPSEGWIMGGQTIVVIGDNFREGLQVIFGSFPVLSQVISSHAVRVQSPPRANPGTVEVTLALDSHQYNIAVPGMFKYVSPTEPSLDYGFARLSKLVPRYPGDPARLSREAVLDRAADVAEAFYSVPMPGIIEDEELKNHSDEQQEILLLPWQEAAKVKETF